MPVMATISAFGDDRVKAAGPCRSYGRRGLGFGEPQEEGDGEKRQDGNCYSVAPEESGKRTRPGVALVCLQAKLRQDSWQIQRELVRRSVLAGVIAAAAIVAEVGEIAQIAAGELTAQLDGRKDGAIAFAIPAGVADFHEAAGLLLGFRGGQFWPPLCRQCGRRPRQWPCPRRQHSPVPKYCRP